MFFRNFDFCNFRSVAKSYLGTSVFSVAEVIANCLAFGKRCSLVTDLTGGVVALVMET